MDFRTAEEMVGTYLKNNVRSNESDDKFFYTILEGLKSEYAPMVEMTKEQARVFQLYYDSKKPFNRSDFEYPDNLFMKSINEKDLMQAWLHPEMIKVV